MLNKVFLSRMAWFCLLFVLQTSASAGNNGWYLGFSMGSADINAINESDLGYKLTTGYLDRNFGAELGVVGLGDNYTADNVDIYGVSMEMLARFPVTPRMSLLGRAGIFWWTVENCYNSYYYYYCPYGSYDDGSDLTYGLGMQFDLNHHISLRGEWQEFRDVGGNNITLLSAGFVYTFY